MKTSATNCVKQLAIAFGLVLSTNASYANVLTFDDIGGISGVGDYCYVNCFATIPNTYGGFTWDNMYYYYNNIPNSGYGYGIVSGTFAAFNGSGTMAVTSGGSLFNFTGAYLTGAWNDGLNVNVKGYTGGVLMYDQTVVASAIAPSWFQFNYSGVDKLEFSSYGGTNYWSGGYGTQFVMDNFTYSAVPVPAAAWLFGSGLMGLIGFSRKRVARKMGSENKYR